MNQKVLALLATLLLPMVLPLILSRAGIRVPARKWAVWYIFWLVLASLLVFQIYTIEHVLWVSPSRLDFGEDLDMISFFVSNNGSGVIRWEIQGPMPGWLSLDPKKGDTVGGEKDYVRVRVNRSRMTRPESSTRLSISSRSGENASVTITVSRGG